MKKFFAIAAAAALAMSLAGCGASTTTNESTETAASAESDLQYIQDNGTMKIGYTVMEPLNYTDDNGDFVGFETEFSAAVCEKLGVTPEYIEINWDSKEIELNSKNIDCIWNGLTITDERKETMSISTPYLENRQALVVKAENADKFKESLDGANVIAESGSAGAELMAADESFANAVTTEVASQATALMDVAAGTSDVAVIDYVMAAGSVGEGTDFADLVIVDMGYESEEYGIAFRKDSDVTEAVNAVITELVADGTLKTIADKYNLTELLIAE